MTESDLGAVSPQKLELAKRLAIVSPYGLAMAREEVSPLKICVESLGAVSPQMLGLATNCEEDPPPRINWKLRVGIGHEL